jgi:hypothetical protein
MYRWVQLPSPAFTCGDQSGRTSAPTQMREGNHDSFATQLGAPSDRLSQIRAGMSAGSKGRSRQSHSFMVLKPIRIGLNGTVSVDSSIKSMTSRRMRARSHIRQQAPPSEFPTRQQHTAGAAPGLFSSCLLRFVFSAMILTRKSVDVLMLYVVHREWRP